MNRKRVQRLMRVMGIEAIYQKPHTSQKGQGHRIYPYLLRKMTIDRPDFVWASDITFVRLSKGIVYLVAMIDWFSRYVLSWRLSNTMESDFCVDALEEALSKGRPEIFNTDQGSQFTSSDHTNCLRNANVLISMDGKGRCLDNVFVERLWRSVKYENIFLNDYETVSELRSGLALYFQFYCEDRPHQRLSYRTPGMIYRGAN